MWMLETLGSFVSRKFIISTAYPALLILPLILQTGCSGDGAGGPIISSLSTPTDATEGLHSDQAPNSGVTDSDEEKDPVITMASTSKGVTAHLTWDHPSHFKVTGYYIYYGKRSSEELSPEEHNSEESNSQELSSCSHGEAQIVEAPPASITGLEPNTPYFFAIRAFNESENLCSNEITAVTPPAQS